MFRRTFWFTAGAAAGVWATTKVNRKIRQLTPESLAAQAANKAIDAGHRLQDFALDVRAAMAQRESELGGALGLEAPSDHALPEQRRLIAIDRTEYMGTEHDPRTEHSNDTHNRNEDH